MGFSRREYWSGLPCLPPGDLPGSGIKPASSALQAHALPLSHQGSPLGARGYVLLWSQENQGPSPSGSEEKGSPQPTRHQICHLQKPVKHKHFGEPFGNDYYYIYICITMEFTIPLPGMSPKFLTSVQRYLYKDVYWSMDTIGKMWNNINRRKVKKRYIHPVGYDASKKK